MAISKLEGWISNTVPQVYTNGMSFYEVLSAVLAKLDEVIDLVNGVDVEEVVRDTLQEWFDNGKLAEIINDQVFGLINADVALAKMAAGVVPQQFGAKGDGVANDTAAIQEALDNHHYIYVPEGTYVVTATLMIERNTHFKMHPNARLLRKHNDMIMSNHDLISAGYNGQGNLIIEGGIWDCNGVNYPDTSNGIGLKHGENITIRDLTLYNPTKAHAIEVSGCKNVLIDNVKFLGYLIDPTYYYVEAIQIEPTLPPPAGATYTFPYVTDSTPPKDIIVQNCYLGASKELPAYPCFVGAHGVAHDIWYDNIKIINNTIEGTTYWAIRPFKFINSLVEGNTIRGGSGGAIYVVTPGGGESTKDKYGEYHDGQPIFGVQVKNNTIEDMDGKGIYMTGTDTAYIRNSQITGNTIKNVTGYSIQLEKAEYCQARDNIIESSGRFNVAYARDLDVDNNVLNKITDNAFMVTEVTSSTFKDNRIDDAKFYGFNIGGTCARIMMDRNTIKNVQTDTAADRAYVVISAGADDIRFTHNYMRRDSGYKIPLHGLLVYTGVTKMVRFGNDIRVGAAVNLLDNNAGTVTTPTDITA